MDVSVADGSVFVREEDDVPQLRRVLVCSVVDQRMITALKYVNFGPKYSKAGPGGAATLKVRAEVVVEL
jgi:hypothetical protein